MTKTYFQEANNLKQAGKLDEAIEYYHRSTLENPNFYLSYQNQGDTFAKLGRWDEAVESYRSAINLNPNSAWSHHDLGHCFAKTSRWSESISAYLRTIEISPKFYLFYNKLGEIFEQIAANIKPESLGNYNWQEILPKSHQDANQDHSALIEQYNIEDEQFLKATSYLDNHNFLEEVYQVYLKRTSDAEGENYYISLLIQGMKRQEILMAVRHSDEFKSKLVSALRGINLYYLSDELFLQSTEPLKESPFVEEVYRTYLKREADHVGKNNYLDSLANGMSRPEIVAIFRKSAEFTYQLTMSISAICLQESISAYRRANKLNPNSCKPKNNLGIALTGLGKIQAQTGQVDRAIQSYREAVATSQNLAEVYYNQGNALLQQGKRDEAIEYFKKAIYAKPNWIHPYLSLGEVLKVDSPDECIYWWNKVIPYIQEENTKIDLQTKIGTMLVEKGKINEAIAIWQETIPYINSESNRIDMQFSIGNLLVKQGKLDEALEVIENAMGLTDFIPT